MPAGERDVTQAARSAGLPWLQAQEDEGFVARFAPPHAVDIERVNLIGQRQHVATLNDDPSDPFQSSVSALHGNNHLPMHRQGSEVLRSVMDDLEQEYREENS